MPNPKDSSFALPNARNTSMLVSFVLGDANFSRFIRRVLPDASQWNIGGVGPSGVGAGVGHVHFFLLCVDFICVRWSTQTQYPVEYGPKVFKKNQFKMERIKRFVSI